MTYVSYWHAYAVVRVHGETGITAGLEPATIGGLVYASSMLVLYGASMRSAAWRPPPRRRPIPRSIRHMAGRAYRIHLAAPAEARRRRQLLGVSRATIYTYVPEVTTGRAAAALPPGQE